MGSARFRSEGRELVRERRLARMRRNDERRQARELKRAQIAAVLPARSAAERLAEDEVRSTVDGIVVEALKRHDRRTTSTPGHGPSGAEASEVEARPAAPSLGALEAAPPPRAGREPRLCA